MATGHSWRTVTSLPEYQERFDSFSGTSDLLHGGSKTTSEEENVSVKRKRAEGSPVERRQRTHMTHVIVKFMKMSLVGLERHFTDIKIIPENKQFYFQL